MCAQGLSHLQSTLESGERHELPHQGPGQAPTENEFGYSTALLCILVAIMLMILRCMQMIDRRQHSCRKTIWPGQVVWSTV